MRAFILRRVGLIRHAQGGVVLIGPGHGGDTLRLQRFLTRNGYPHRLFDTEARPGCRRLPRAASSSRRGSLPVVIVRRASGCCATRPTPRSPTRSG